MMDAEVEVVISYTISMGVASARPDACHLYTSVTIVVQRRLLTNDDTR
jgi:hypothetical protein